MSDKSLTVKGNYDLAAPSQMAAMAKVLKTHIVQHQLYVPIQEKNYVYVEGWQFAGGLMGTYPRIVKVENISVGTEKKWRADAEIVRMKDDKVVGFGTAICSNAEAKKKSFDEYAILSMAQTRAIGKAYRNLIGWVMKLAGYEATPGEEMFKMGDIPAHAAPAAAKPSAKDGLTGYECHVGAEPISKAEYDYSKKIFGKPLCREHQKNAKRK